MFLRLYWPFLFTDSVHMYGLQVLENLPGTIRKTHGSKADIQDLHIIWFSYYAGAHSSLLQKISYALYVPTERARKFFELKSKKVATEFSVEKLLSF